MVHLACTHKRRLILLHRTLPLAKAMVLVVWREQVHLDSLGVRRSDMPWAITVGITDVMQAGIMEEEEIHFLPKSAFQRIARMHMFVLLPFRKATQRKFGICSA
jgi:hypothetical protein